MITRDDWLAALADATAPPPDDPDLLTVRELGEVLGLSREQTSRKVRILVAAGKAEQGHKLLRMADGRVVKVPAYRLLK